MSGRRIAPLGVLLSAFIAAMPVVRTVCAWDCARPQAAAETAGEEHAGHCAPQPGESAAAPASASAMTGCAVCGLLDEAPRALVRHGGTGHTVGDLPPAAVEADARSAPAPRFAVLVRSGSPPPAFQVPLRI